MPQFIKMGLGGTGYMGKKESHKRAARTRAKRRKVEKGFPVYEPFRSVDDVRRYLAGEKIICLLCGQSYRRIGTHLTTIHQMTPDEYREKYKIPWGYGLNCSESTALYSESAKARNLGDYSNPENLAKAQRTNKRLCPFKKEIARENVKHAPRGGHPRRPLFEAPGGGPETFTQRRERLTAKKGTLEFYEKMKNRPQVAAAIPLLKTFWKGKKQDPEHVRKRIAAMVATKTGIAKLGIRIDPI